MDGQAKHRALAYLAHGGTVADGEPASVMNPVFGLAFGTLYDVSTVAILALAGLSFAMTLASWIPPYLARLGMEFHWSVKLGGLVWLFTALKFAVTAYFGADVDAHRAAYLTGVLAVFAFAALAATLDVWQRRQERGWRKAFRVPPLFLLRVVGVHRESRLGRLGAAGRGGDRGRVHRPRAGCVDREPGVALARNSASTGSSSRTRRPRLSGRRSRRPITRSWCHSAPAS